MTRAAPRHACAIALGIAILASVVLWPRGASAQLHWDASAQVGGMKRFLVSRPDGAKDAGFGPVGQLTGHLALLPLVRVGGYFGHDISPIGGESSARDLTWGGIRAKIMSPYPRGDLRAWLFVGFGYAGVYARSTTASSTTVQGAGGGFFEVPFGIGASYKLRKPWELCAELGMHAGFGHHGSAYEAPGPTLSTAGQPDTNVLPAGKDRFAIGLTVGVLLDL